jgi:hypothetical protein
MAEPIRYWSEIASETRLTVDEEYRDLCSSYRRTVIL